MPEESWMSYPAIAPGGQTKGREVPILMESTTCWMAQGKEAWPKIIGPCCILLPFFRHGVWQRYTWQGAQGAAWFQVPEWKGRHFELHRHCQFQLALWRHCEASRRPLNVSIFAMLKSLLEASERFRKGWTPSGKAPEAPGWGQWRLLSSVCQKFRKWWTWLCWYVTLPSWTKEKYMVPCII